MSFFAMGIGKNGIPFEFKLLWTSTIRFKQASANLEIWVEVKTSPADSVVSGKVNGTVSELI
jgi:hypothetical protein